MHCGFRTATPAKNQKSTGVSMFFRRMSLLILCPHTAAIDSDKLSIYRIGRNWRFGLSISTRLTLGSTRHLFAQGVECISRDRSSYRCGHPRRCHSQQPPATAIDASTTRHTHQYVEDSGARRSSNAAPIGLPRSRSRSYRSRLGERKSDTISW